MWEYEMDIKLNPFSGGAEDSEGAIDATSDDSDKALKDIGVPIVERRKT